MGVLVFNRGAYGIPKYGIRNFLKPLKGIPIEWTKHALIRAREKRVKIRHKLTYGHIVEVYVDSDSKFAFKWVIRIKTIDHHDVYVVSELERGKLTMITCWRNDLDDNHDTLDKSKYNRPEEFTTD